MACECNAKIHNFLWSRNFEKRKLVMLKWNKVNRHRRERCLGLGQLKHINLAMLMKLSWSFLMGEDELGRFLKFKFVDKNDDIVKRYKKSTICAGVKQGLKELQGTTQWLLKDGSKVDFWRDYRAGSTSLKNRLGYSEDFD